MSVFFAFWTQPFYALAPGSVRETTERVAVNGADVYLPDGEIGFVTVSLTGDISMWEYLWAKIDDDVDLVPEEEINGDGTADEKREEDRRRMQSSKDDATVVALEYLGYEVPRIGLGVEVVGIIECMPAENLLVTGDLILAVNDQDVAFRADLIEALEPLQPGDRADLLVNSITTGATELVTLRMGSSLDPCLGDEVEGDERAMLGIGLSETDLVDYELPFDVEIDSDRVGGPSAGLAFTLAIMDVLTPGELTGGLNVATTGTIRIDGTVGRVGGVRQKTVAARDAGVDLFIVPLDEEEASRSFAGDDMTVVGVENLEDALEALSAVGGNGLEVASPPVSSN